MQETFCRVLIYPKDPEKISNLFSYLLLVMRNIWRDKWVKEHMGFTESLDELQNSGRAWSAEPSVEPEVLRILENEELMAEMEVKKGPLTNREELLFTLYLNGFNCKEIAARLNEDVRLTRSDLNAVRTKIRSRLKRAITTHP